MTATGASHCFTVSPPKISSWCFCGMFCFVFFCLFRFGLCWFACERDLLVLTAVGQRQHAVFPHVLSQNDRRSCHGAYGNG